MHKQRITMIVLAAVGGLGTFLPWFTVPIVGSINGTAGDGWITMGLFAITVVASSILKNRRAALDARNLVLAVLPSLSAAVLAIYKIVDFYSAMRGESEDNPIVHAVTSSVSVGPGLFVIALMGVSVPALAFVMRGERATGVDASAVASATVQASVPKPAIRRAALLGVWSAVDCAIVILGAMKVRAAEHATAMKAMDDVLAVALMQKQVYPMDHSEGRYSEHNGTTVAFQNKSAKALIGIKGKLLCKDIFGDDIASFGVKVDEPIAAGATYVFRAADAKFANTTPDKIKARWVPDTYLFKDGTSLTAPDEHSKQ